MLEGSATREEAYQARIAQLEDDLANLHQDLTTPPNDSHPTDGEPDS